MYMNMCASGRCLRYAFCWLLKEEQGGRKRPFSSTSFSKGRHFPCKLYSEAAEAGGARWSWPWPRPEARARRTRPGFASAASLGSVADGLLLGLLRVSAFARALHMNRTLALHMQCGPVNLDVLCKCNSAGEASLLRPPVSVQVSSGSEHGRGGSKVAKSRVALIRSLAFPLASALRILWFCAPAQGMSVSQCRQPEPLTRTRLWLKSQSKIKKHDSLGQIFFACGAL